MSERLSCGDLNFVDTGFISSAIVNEARDYGVPIEGYDAVDINDGRKTLATCHEAIMLFRDFYLHSLPIGSLTIDEMAGRIHKILNEPTGVLISREFGSQYSREDKGSDKHTDNVMIGQLSIECNKTEVAAASESAGLYLDDEQIGRLAAFIEVWHELGHCLQFSCEQTQGTGQFNLSRETLLSGVRAPVFDEGNTGPLLGEGMPTVACILNTEIESESFATGFGHMLAEDYLVNTLGVLSQQAAQFRGALNSDIRRETTKDNLAAIRGMQILHERPDADLLASPMFTYAFDIASIAGYGLPYAPEDVMNTLRITP